MTKALITRGSWYPCFEVTVDEGQQVGFNGAVVTVDEKTLNRWLRIQKAFDAIQLEMAMLWEG